MTISQDLIFGKWTLIKWESQLLDSETEDVYQDERNNIISQIQVYETDKWYSNLYSGLFKKEFNSYEDLRNYSLNFKSQKDHRGHFEVELTNIKTRNVIGEFWWTELANDDYPQNANVELSLLDYSTYGNIDNLTKDKLVFTDITEGVSINGKVNYEYAIHQLTFIRSKKSEDLKQSNVLIKSNRVYNWIKNKIN